MTDQNTSKAILTEFGISKWLFIRDKLILLYAFRERLTSSTM